MAPSDLPAGGEEVPPRTLTGGIVAYNVEDHIERSVRSLLTQELPDGVRWDRIWVVASGCTDRTVEVARRLALDDERIRLLVEPERRGKSAAVGEILTRSVSNAVVLLNSDAAAQSGAVAALLQRAPPGSPPYAVMGRPVVPEGPEDEWRSTLRWMWDLHHEYHLELLRDGTGAHLCDELLLLGGPRLPPLPAGVINDGSYFATWLAIHGGRCWYAPEARVEIEIPRWRREHLAQRRRIHVGNAQIADLLRAAPTTLPRFLCRHPRRALRSIARTLARDGGIRHFVRIAIDELTSRGQAWWDRRPPARDYVRWAPVTRAAPVPDRTGAGTGRTATLPEAADRRAALLLTVAERFGSGLPLEEFARLMPVSMGVGETARWIAERPELAAIEDGHVSRPGAPPGPNADRRHRGALYRAEAVRVFSGPLAFADRWARCALVTGSTAYGEPEDGDDLDIFMIARRGTLWLLLLRAYLTLRLRGRGTGRPLTTICLNYVLEEGEATREFTAPHGSLFAREALSAYPIFGDEYYRALLGRSPWMEKEFPRLYAERRSPSIAPPAPPVAWPVRVLNAGVYPVLASYLQLVGLVRNRRARSAATREASFRTLTRPARVMFASRRFEDLRRSYESFESPVDRSGGAVDSSVGPAAPWRGASR